MKSLTFRLVVTVTAFLAAACAFFFVWNNNAKQEAMEESVLAEARTLSIEMLAVWDYVNEIQAKINHDSDGMYDFKHVYCSLAGKNIATKFVRRADGYIVRYVRHNPRSGADQPDEFENAALAAFDSGSCEDYYGMSEYDGKPVFRYVSVLKVKGACLSCHGAPAGEIDETGFTKEGMEVGDIAGCISISIPVESYEKNARADALRTLVFFVAILLLVSVVLLVSLNHWITLPLVKANRSLIVENEKKTDFLTSMTHDLRAPLTSIIAYSEMLDRPSVSPENSQRAVAGIRGSSTQLLGMVNNTVDTARFEAGKLPEQFEEGDVLDLIDSAIAIVKPLADKKGISLTKSIDPAIPILTMDWSMIHRILTNLVNNAIKFTEEGGEIRISAALSGKMLKLEVSDTGIGIADEHQKRIFDKYVQVPADQTTYCGGNGLGLYLVKNLTEHMGGTVSLSSEIGKGSTFTILLPVDPSDFMKEQL